MAVCQATGRAVAAQPPDERKGYAFPLVDLKGSAASPPDRSIDVQLDTGMPKVSRTHLSVFAAAVTIIVYFVIMPSNCELLSTDYGPQSCHTVPLPEYCCTDFRRANIAEALLIIGILVSLILFWTRPKGDNKPAHIFD